MSRRPPATDDEQWAGEQLRAGEQALWERMGNVDRRHSIVVAHRFVVARPDATRFEIAGALLHDVGKVESGLGPLGRVLATLVGPRGRRFRRYHDHEAIGARLAAAAGSDPATVELIEDRGPAAPALATADHV